MKITFEYLSLLSYQGQKLQLLDPDMWEGMIKPDVRICDDCKMIVMYIQPWQIRKMDSGSIEFWNQNELNFPRDCVWELTIESED